MPAAIADPITPATLGPIACIRRKLFESASRPTLLETRAAIGTAETPAEPAKPAEPEENEKVLRQTQNNIFHNYFFQIKY